MAATDVTRAPNGAQTTSGPGAFARRVTTETKAAFKTTEFYSYVAVLVGLLIAGLATQAGDGADDRFQAHQVWLYATILTVGYMISRGLAKSGSREPYTDDGDARRDR
jgi:hypothetical protein